MLADAVPDYADADRALRAHSARRRSRAAVGTAAAAVLVVIAAIAYALPHPSLNTPDPSWIVPAHPVDLIYPPDLRLGSAPVPPLPDGKVGPALLAAQTSAPELCAPACPRAVLFTVDGERYALPDDAAADGSLSPDGRWLLGTFGQSNYALRDL